jgi:phospholipid/cholesterol/gamma-HCH transport system permease protein
MGSESEGNENFFKHCVDLGDLVGQGVGVGFTRLAGVGESSYSGGVENGNVSGMDVPQRRFLFWAPLPRAYSNYFGRMVIRFLLTIQGLGAFFLITMGVIFTKFRRSRSVVWPLVWQELNRSGVKLLPMFLFLSLAMGLVVIGQAVSWLTRVNAVQYLGTIMVLVVVREIGPILTAVLVLARSGAANVIELGTARALGEVEALEALVIDPVHYLVMPRVIGMAVSVFSLTIYFILGSLLSGYMWAFLQDVPMRPGDYFAQLGGALSYTDFIVLAAKSILFGVIISVITCYHGLAQPLRLEEVSNATVRAVAQSVVACVALDAVFIIIYLIL